MEQKNYFYITVILAVLLVLVATFVVINTDFSTYKYSIVRNGVEFVSNTSEPSVILQEIKDSKRIIVSPRFTEKGTENSYMLSSVTLFSTVLISKEKEVIMIGRILDEDNNLKECQSNLGDVKVNKTLSIEECNQMLSDTETIRIFISFPDPSLSKPRVILEPRKITIIPNSFEGVSAVSFIVLEALYEDSEEIIKRVNAIVGQL